MPTIDDPLPLAAAKDAKTSSDQPCKTEIPDSSQIAIGLVSFSGNQIGSFAIENLTIVQSPASPRSDTDLTLASTNATSTFWKDARDLVINVILFIGAGAILPYIKGQVGYWMPHVI